MPLPTLDKPGKTIIPGCGICDITAGIWSFTDSKVQNGNEIKACAVNTDTHEYACAFGTAHKDRMDTIRIPLGD